ncbi:Hypothetical predicted protein, partial [Xyrichtys novacula]
MTASTWMLLQTSHTEKWIAETIRDQIHQRPDHYHTAPSLLQDQQGYPSNQDMPPLT